MDLVQRHVDDTDKYVYKDVLSATVRCFMTFMITSSPKDPLWKAPMQFVKMGSLISVESIRHGKETVNLDYPSGVRATSSNMRFGP